MKTKFALLRFPLIIVLGFCLLAGSTMTLAFGSSAAPIYKLTTIITFNPIPDINVGQPVIVSGVVTILGGGPVAKKDVTLLINGIKTGSVKTDANGHFIRKFTKIKSAGTYTVQGSISHTRYLLPTVAYTHFKMNPVDMQVQTIPPLSGVTFEMDGQTAISGIDGIATFQVKTAGHYLLSVLLSEYTSQNDRIQFARWTDETFKPYTAITVPSTVPVEVGLDVWEQVSQSFVDLSGTSVPFSRITSITIRSSQGDSFTFTDNLPHWIPASRVIRRSEGLQVAPLLYSVVNVMVDGANAVNSLQQRYYVQANSNWKVNLILYSLTLHATDGLFGSTVGRSIDLVYPNGKVVNYPFDPYGLINLNGLVRGNYTARVVDASGLKQVIPISLSRSQSVDIKVPTYKDIFVILGLGLMVLISFIVYRGFRFGTFRSRRNRPAPQPAPHAVLEPAVQPVVSRELDLGDTRPVRIKSSARK